MEDQFPLLHDVDVPGKPRWVKLVSWIPVFGWIIGFQFQLGRERALVSQAVDRGRVPDSVWDAYPHDPDARRKIEQIVVANAYPKGSTFHPLDPVELMFVLRYGDLNEVEIVMEIEKCFGIQLTDAELIRMVNERTTFIEFLRFVGAQRRHNPSGSASA